MKQYFAALNALIDALNPLDLVEGLKTFAAIDSLARTMEESLDMPAYPVEKLRKFRWDALYAIVPGEMTRHLPTAHYISEARFALRQAEEALLQSE